VTDDEEPWYRTQTAIFAAGGLGLVLVVTLFAMVVRMSGEWENPTPTTPRVTASYPSETETSILTPSSSTTTYTTSVPLSTSEIPGEPLPSETSETSESEDPDETTTETTTTTSSSGPVTTTDEQDYDAEETTTTRNRPRFNETRTVYPAP